VPRPHTPPADRLGIASLLVAALSLFTCLPMLTALGAFGGLLAFRRARREAAPTRWAVAALLTAGLALALQTGFGMLATRWLAPAMQRRTHAAIEAALAGNWAIAVPASPTTMSFAPPMPAPSEAGTAIFAQQVRDALGTLRSISIPSEQVAGSPLSPTVSLALVLEFERGAVTGAARVQWLPADDTESGDWLPQVRLLELEVSLPGVGSATLAPETSTNDG
jgi:hypothetical protein